MEDKGPYQNQRKVVHLDAIRVRKEYERYKTSLSGQINDIETRILINLVGYNLAVEILDNPKSQLPKRVNAEKSKRNYGILIRGKLKEYEKIKEFAKENGIDISKDAKQIECILQSEGYKEIISKLEEELNDGE